jgi:hypothetical protein
MTCSHGTHAQYYPLHMAPQGPVPSLVTSHSEIYVIPQLHGVSVDYGEGRAQSQGCPLERCQVARFGESLIVYVVTDSKPM